MGKGGFKQGLRTALAAMAADIMLLAGMRGRSRSVALATATPVPVTSKLAAHLLRTFAWGSMSLPELQQIAALVEEDVGRQHVPRELLQLAGLSFRGTYPANMRREHLPRADLRRNPGLKIGNACMRCSMPALNPVDVFYRVLELQPQLICRSQDALESFWEAVSEHPGVRHHPVKQVPGYKSRAVPLVLHGDGAPIDSQDRSCAFVSWRSLVATRASTRLAHQLFCAVWTSHINVGNGALSSCCTGACFGGCMGTALPFAAFDAFLGWARTTFGAPVFGGF